MKLPRFAPRLRDRRNDINCSVFIFLGKVKKSAFDSDQF